MHSAIDVRDMDDNTHFALKPLTITLFVIFLGSNTAISMISLRGALDVAVVGVLVLSIVVVAVVGLNDSLLGGFNLLLASNVS